MSDDWAEVQLCEVFAADNTKSGQHDEEPRVLSLSKYDGLVPADEYFDKRIASAHLDGYKVVEPEGWAYSTIHIDEGSIARNNLGHSGVISPMYTTMNWVGHGHDPRFFEHLLRSPALLSLYRDSAQGTVNRRRSLPFATFAALRVVVPPLPMQGRIVDLIDHLDDHLANLRAERASADSVLDVVRSFVPEGPDRPIGDLVLGIDSGRSPLTDGEVPITGEPRILKLSAVRPGLFDATEAKRLSAVHGMPGSTLVGEGDVLVTRSNTPDRVGYCARARGVPVETYLPDLIWRVRLDTKECDADYFEQVLSSRLGRALVTNAASGTSQSMRKINKAGFSSLAIPLPSLGEQRRYAGDALAVWETVLTIDREVRALSRVRNAVLHSLLTRSVEIPESYDSSVGEAV